MERGRVPSPGSGSEESPGKAPSLSQTEFISGADYDYWDDAVIAMLRRSLARDQARKEALIAALKRVLLKKQVDPGG